MRPAARLTGLFAVLLGAAVVPFITSHALLLHFTGMAHDGLSRWIGDPGLLGVAALTVVSSASTAGVLVAVLQWRAQERRVARLSRDSEMRELFGVPVIVVPGPDVVLFAAGAYNSKVFVSEGAVRSLPPDVLKAGILHEVAHSERRDVAWCSALAVIERAFGRLPGVGKGVGTLALRAECAADERALAMGADRRSLFDAIVAAATGPSALPSLSGAAVMPRLERLAGSDPGMPRIPILGPAVVAAWLLVPPLLAHAAIVIGAVCAARL